MFEKRREKREEMDGGIEVELSCDRGTGAGSRSGKEVFRRRREMNAELEMYIRSRLDRGSRGVVEVKSERVGTRGGARSEWTREDTRIRGDHLDSRDHFNPSEKITRSIAQTLYPGL